MPRTEGDTRAGTEGAGFSLLESMTALAVGLVLAAMLFALWGELLRLGGDFSENLETGENVWLAALLLPEWIAVAGNGGQGQGWAGVQIWEGQLDLRSDLDGPGGFPDGSLEQSFEDLSLRLQGTDLQLRSGDGSFQPLFRRIQSVRFEQGSPSWLEVLLETERALAQPQGPPSTVVRVGCHLWNYRRSLFVPVP